mmetsp:Transcript_21128/g.44556  ORF Transcript_21128/g.44556 Transcript_21128/m.44556 type:complete len:212 (-) Transcript_21128:828-1463(-)
MAMAALSVAIVVVMLVSPATAFGATGGEDCSPVYSCLLRPNWLAKATASANLTYTNSPRTLTEIWEHFADHNVFRLTDGFVVKNISPAPELAQPYDEFGPGHIYEVTPQPGLTLRIMTTWSDPKAGLVFSWMAGCGAVGAPVTATLGHEGIVAYIEQVGEGTFYIRMGTTFCQPDAAAVDGTSAFFTNFFETVLNAQIDWIAGGSCDPCEH